MAEDKILTEEARAKLRTLEAHATPGVWSSQYDRSERRKGVRITESGLTGNFIAGVAPRQQIRTDHQGGIYPAGDAEFIPAARNNLIPALDYIDSLESKIEELTEALRERDDYYECGFRDCMNDAAQRIKIAEESGRSNGIGEAAAVCENPEDETEIATYLGTDVTVVRAVAKILALRIRSLIPAPAPHTRGRREQIIAWLYESDLLADFEVWNKQKG